MNRRAAGLGMTRTAFASPHGLDDEGVSTPRDLLRLALVARGEPAFRSIVASRFERVPSPRGPDRRVQNRNVLLWLFAGATGMKTGSTAGAGACLVATAERRGRGLVAIVLGARSEAFSDAAALLEHGFAAFRTHRARARRRGPRDVAIDGRHVPVTAAGTVEGLVHVGRVPVRELAVDPAAAFPPVPGSAWGLRSPCSTASVSVGMTALVAGTPAPPRPVEGAWWLRALGALGSAAADAVDGLAA